MLAAMSVAGFFIHGFVMSLELNNVLWCVMYLLLTFAICAYAIAVKYDLDGEKGLAPFFKRSILIASIVAVALGVMNYLLPDWSFLLFSAYGLAYMIYCIIRLWGKKKETPAFGWYIVAIIVMIIGSVLQSVKSIHFTIIWEFNYNAVYHWMTLLFMLIQFHGVRRVAADRK